MAAFNTTTVKVDGRALATTHEVIGSKVSRLWDNGTTRVLLLKDQGPQPVRRIEVSETLAAITTGLGSDVITLTATKINGRAISSTSIRVSKALVDSYRDDPDSAGTIVVVDGEQLGGDQIVVTETPAAVRALL